MKFAKQTDIDNLSVGQVEDLQEVYKSFLKDNKGVDPEFVIPGSIIGNGKSKR